MPQQPEFNAKVPLPLMFDAQRVPWADRHSADVTAGAPQQLHRHIVDALGKLGYRPVYVVEPAIYGQAIGDTGITQGYVLGEKYLHSVRDPYNAFRLVGLMFGLTSIGWVLLALVALSQGSWAFLIVSLSLLGIFLGVGAMLLGQHAFDSRLLYVTLKGEVYRSGLDARVQKPSQVAGSQRLSILSELRVDVWIAGVRSRNEAGRRVVFAPTIAPDLRAEFQAAIGEMAATALPKAILQKSVDQTKHEVLIRCGYCSTLNRQEEALCTSCGAPLALETAVPRDGWRSLPG